MTYTDPGESSHPGPESEGEAFKETDAVKRAEGLKRAGAAYAGAFVLEDADRPRYIWRHRSESASQVRIDKRMRDTLDRVVATLHQLSRR